MVTAEGYEEFAQDILVLKPQIYSQAEMFNFTMKRIHEAPESPRKVTATPWVFEFVRPPRPTTSPSVKIPTTTSLSFLSLVNIF